MVIVPEERRAEVRVGNGRNCRDRKDLQTIVNSRFAASDGDQRSNRFHISREISWPKYGMDFLAPRQIGLFSHKNVMEQRTAIGNALPEKIANPKRNASMCSRSSWLPYYAGFSADFVRSMLENLPFPEGATLLDPWNGAGTTTQVGFDLGWNVIGFDINPVMAIIARARLVRTQQISTVRTKARAVIAIAKAARKEASLPDALGQWYQLPCISAVRSVTRAIEDVCDVSESPVTSRAESVDETACFLFVCLFSAVRDLSSKAKCSNPTWTLRIRDGRSKIWFEKATLIDQFTQKVSSFLDTYQAERNRYIYRGPTKTEILTGDSRSLPLENSSVDAVVTSPPYCTRIDYSVTTSIESAIAFGAGITNDSRVRDDFMGTSTIRSEDYFPDEDVFDGYVLETLNAIRTHQSYASASYYAKTYRQYFFDLEHSLAEITRTLRSPGRAVLVVQDSYYKDLHIDLARVCVEAFTRCGLSVVHQADFPVLSDIAAINSKSRRYRSSASRHTESVLIFEKA